MPDGIRLPGATWKPFTNRTVSSLPWAGPGTIIGHTIVGTRDGAWSYHNQPGIAYVQLYYDQHGNPIQTTGLEFRSAGTLELNPYVIAIEVADSGPGFDAWDGKCGNVPPMTDAQVAGLIRDCAWMCVALGIEPRELTNSCEALPGGPGGIGWHRLGIDPWRAPGCPLTSNSRGKCCPDDARISQWRHEIIPDVHALVRGKPKEWDEMASKEEIRDVVRGVVRDEVAALVRSGVVGGAEYYLANDKLVGGIHIVRSDHTARLQLTPVLWDWVKALHGISGRSTARVAVDHDVMASIPEVRP